MAVAKRLSNPKGLKPPLCGFQGVEDGKGKAEEAKQNTQRSNAKQSEKAELNRLRSETQQPHRISGDNSLRDPPVPIPNTEVKPQHADGTWLETARESRSSPDSS